MASEGDSKFKYFVAARMWIVNMLLCTVTMQGTKYVIFHFPKVFGWRTIASHLLSGPIFSRMSLRKCHAGEREL